VVREAPEQWVVRPGRLKVIVLLAKAIYHKDYSRLGSARERQAGMLERHGECKENVVARRNATMLTSCLYWSGSLATKFYSKDTTNLKRE
jgi:hypothetical protein